MTARRVITDALLAAAFITAWIAGIALASTWTGGQGL